MSVSPLMSVGVRAMAANYAALQTTGHNIANANVAGYSRQQVDLVTAQGKFSGAGYFGQGVDVASVVRSHDAFLTKEAASANSLAGMDAARLEQLTRLENIFRTGEAGLGHAAGQFLNSMTDLASRPSDIAVRQVVLSHADDLAKRFSEAAVAFDSSQATVTAGLKASIAEINGLAGSIAEVNRRIVALRGNGQPANDLLDQRDQLISKLSGIVQVTRIDADDGSVGIFIGGGQRLVLGADAAQLQVIPDAADPSRSAVAVSVQGAPLPIADDAFGGGSVAGLLRFQNRDLVDARNLVGRLAAAIAGAVNTQQNLGLNLRPAAQQGPGGDLFSTGPSLALPRASNQRDAAGAPIAGVALTVTDPARLQASDYDLSPDPSAPGTWQLTRLSDGHVRSVANGDVVDGFRIDFGTPAPLPGDRFLLQPVARAATGMTRLIDDPRDLAAASPLVASTSASNTGTVSVASLAVRATPLPFPGATTRVTFSDDAGSYNWSRVGADGVEQASGSGLWQPGQAIPAPPLDFNGYALQLAGQPRSGDVVTIEPTPANAMSSNNGNALAMLALRDAGIADGRTATEAWAQALTEIGVRVQSARSSSEMSGAVAGQAESVRSASAGVNLDEEAARLLQYQQSYQAAAKVLQVAQTIFDTLMSAASGR